MTRLFFNGDIGVFFVQDFFNCDPYGHFEKKTVTIKSYFTLKKTIHFVIKNQVRFILAERLVENDYSDTNKKVASL